MNSFCLATVIYPGAEKYCADFFAALITLPQMRDSTLFIVNQGGVDLSAHLSAVKCAKVEVINVDNDISIAAVRSTLFSALKEKVAADIYIFTDIDDRLTPNAFSHHQAALHNADFSYGNMNLYKEGFTHDLNKKLFSLSGVPATINSISPLLQAHFTGLSAFALTRAALQAVPASWPDNVIYLDWWLVCSLVLAGKEGAAARTVIDYRLYDRGLKALQRPDNIDILETRTAEIINTLQALPANTSIFDAINKLGTLQQSLQTQPESVLLAAASQVPEWILWFEDVFLLADHFSAAHK